MSVKQYTSKWITTKIRSETYEEISRVIDSDKRFGVPRYDSISDFIQQACVVQLQKRKKKGLQT